MSELTLYDFFCCNKIINLEIKCYSNLLISTNRLYEIIFLNEILEFDTILGLGTYDRMVGFVWNRGQRGSLELLPLPGLDG